MSQDDPIWAQTQRELQAMEDRLQELIDWSEDEHDAKAFVNTCEEAMWKVRRVAEAAAQYRVGVLPQKPAIKPDEVECPRCFVKPGEQCDFEAKPRYLADRYDHHSMRADVARHATVDRDQEYMDAFEKAMADR